MIQEGKCNLCGSCCDATKDWSKYLSAIGDYPAVVTEGCPNLASLNENDKRPCKIYGTEHHWFWEESCNVAPPMEEELYYVVHWFRQNPKCSFEYVEE